MQFIVLFVCWLLQLHVLRIWEAKPNMAARVPRSDIATTDILGGAGAVIPQQKYCGPGKQKQTQTT